jgi:hypothetical protein
VGGKAGRPRDCPLTPSHAAPMRGKETPPCPADCLSALTRTRLTRSPSCAPAGVSGDDDLTFAAGRRAHAAPFELARNPLPEDLAGMAFCQSLVNQFTGIY